MQADFWHQRWATNQIGFHQAQANRWLVQFWPALSVQPGSRVLVPLCGKSLDMNWLIEQGCYVVGVELSAKAVEEWFAERGVQPVISEQGAFKVFSGPDCELWCGDFFELSAADIGTCPMFYDRAALIALPEPMRERYARHLQQLLPEHCQGLLITLDYLQHELPGPPFSVPQDWVQRAFAQGWQIDVLDECDVLQQSPKALNSGATRMDERVSLLRR